MDGMLPRRVPYRVDAMMGTGQSCGCNNLFDGDLERHPRQCRGVHECLGYKSVIVR